MCEGSPFNIAEEVKQDGRAQIPDAHPLAKREGQTRIQGSADHPARQATDPAVWEAPAVCGHHAQLDGGQHFTGPGGRR